MYIKGNTLAILLIKKIINYKTQMAKSLISCISYQIFFIQLLILYDFIQGFHFVYVWV